MFYLALANGLAEDPGAAMAATIAEILGMMAAGGCRDAFRMTVAASDGGRIIAYRYSSDAASPSLFYIRGEALAERIGIDRTAAVLVLPEPRDDATADRTTHAREGRADAARLTESQSSATKPNTAPRPPARCSAITIGIIASTTRYIGRMSNSPGTQVSVKSPISASPVRVKKGTT